jgi:hypothetical protein
MIGGIDVHLATSRGGSSAEAAVRAIRQRWPRAVFENGLTGERYPQFGLIPFNDIEEIFVYRDRESADAWDAEGAVPALYNTMIHLVPDDDQLTLVIDERDTAMEELIAAVESALGDAILHVTAEREAA